MKQTQKAKLKNRKRFIAKVYVPQQGKWPYFAVIVRIGMINYELQHGTMLYDEAGTKKLPTGLKLVYTTNVRENSPKCAMKAIEEYNRK